MDLGHQFAMQGGTAGRRQSALVCDAGRAAGQYYGILLHRQCGDELDQGAKHSSHGITGCHNAWVGAWIVEALAVGRIGRQQL